VTSENHEPKDATEATREHHARVLDELPFGDTADFERVRRGLLAEPASPQIDGPLGFPVWDLDQYRFLDGPAPPTVNPSLWRQAQLNRSAGLFEVADGFYQVRGHDLANVTFVRGDTGWIVIDPLTAAETARAALDLVEAHLGPRPVHAVIYTHSHVDHFAGVRGVVDEDDVRAGRVEIIAPEGFLAEAISENVIAGPVMTRRASYMYGALLPRNDRGHVDAGLGKGVPLMGSNGLLAPTRDITVSGTELTIDGVKLVFQLTPGTEAPAEMNFHFPDHRVLCMAENCTANLHNLYTLRGAQVRDALAWSKYIHESIELFGDETDVLFASHHWPRWGRDDALDYLTKQRDTYRYIHDQTMRLANHGLTMNEVAEEIELPASLGTEFFNRDYYGTVNHNAKAVYQRYLGWFDGNPANLHPLPPADAAPRYVELMGGADEVVRRAREAFEQGDYRWVAQLVNHVVFAEPDHAGARALQADTLEQLGYQAESGPWRDFYLTAAQELRHGAPKGLPSPTIASTDVLAAMTVEMLFDLIGVRLNGPAAADRHLRFNVTVTDRGETWHLGVENGALHSIRGRHLADVDASVDLTHAALVALAQGTATLDELRAQHGVTVEGDDQAVESLLGLLETFDFWFELVAP
jgi:alkyl sulfatase BDS1-like metallo-beta-lactamase superfamily hydrolase